MTGSQFMIKCYIECTIFYSIKKKISLAPNAWFLHLLTRAIHENTIAIFVCSCVFLLCILNSFFVCVCWLVHIYSSLNLNLMKFETEQNESRISVMVRPTQLILKASSLYKKNYILGQLVFVFICVLCLCSSCRVYYSIFIIPFNINNNGVVNSSKYMIRRPSKRQREKVNTTMVHEEQDLSSTQPGWFGWIPVVAESQIHISEKLLMQTFRFACGFYYLDHLVMAFI